jgi:hypothetical protein
MAQSVKPPARPGGSRNGDSQDTGFGLFDSFLILMFSAGLDVILLWAASRIKGVPAFETIPIWLRDSSTAIWGAIGSGVTFLPIAIRAFSRRKGPNFLRAILLTMLALIVGIVLLTFLFPTKPKSFTTQTISFDKYDHVNRNKVRGGDSQNPGREVTIDWPAPGKVSNVTGQCLVGWCHVESCNWHDNIAHCEGWTNDGNRGTINMTVTWIDPQ